MKICEHSGVKLNKPSDDIELERAASEYAGGIRIGAYSSQADKYCAFHAGAEWAIEHSEVVKKLVATLNQISSHKLFIGHQGSEHRTLTAQMAYDALSEYDRAVKK
jgi:hypothetical protein